MHFRIQKFAMQSLLNLTCTAKYIWLFVLCDSNAPAKIMSMLQNVVLPIFMFELFFIAAVAAYIFLLF